MTIVLTILLITISILFVSFMYGYNELVKDRNEQREFGSKLYLDYLDLKEENNRLKKELDSYRYKYISKSDLKVKTGRREQA